MTAPSRTRIGLVAGRGEYPILFSRAARAHGVEQLVTVAIDTEADPLLAELADDYLQLQPGQLGKAINAFRDRGIAEVVFAGQVKPGRLFSDIKPDWRAVKLLATLKLRNAATIFGAIAGEFEGCGLTVLPASTYLEDALAIDGQIGAKRLPRRYRDDVELGWRIARESSRLDIGQTVVVRKGTILAVEAFEGTDAAIRRGGELGNEDVVVVKVAKPEQDMRFDIPCIGTRTVESLKAAKAAVLCVQSGKTLFLNQADVLHSLDEAGIAVIGRSE